MTAERQYGALNTTLQDIMYPLLYSPTDGRAISEATHWCVRRIHIFLRVPSRKMALAQPHGIMWVMGDGL